MSFSPRGNIQQHADDLLHTSHSTTDYLTPLSHSTDYNDSHPPSVEPIYAPSDYFPSDIYPITTGLETSVVVRNFIIVAALFIAFWIFTFISRRRLKYISKNTHNSQCISDLLEQLLTDFATLRKEQVEQSIGEIISLSKALLDAIDFRTTRLKQLMSHISEHQNAMSNDQCEDLKNNHNVFESLSYLQTLEGILPVILQRLASSDRVYQLSDRTCALQELLKSVVEAKISLQLVLDEIAKNYAEVLVSRDQYEDIRSMIHLLELTGIPFSQYVPNEHKLTKLHGFKTSNSPDDYSFPSSFQSYENFEPWKQLYMESMKRLSELEEFLNIRKVLLEVFTEVEVFFSQLTIDTSMEAVHDLVQEERNGNSSASSIAPSLQKPSLRNSDYALPIADSGCPSSKLIAPCSIEPNNNSSIVPTSHSNSQLIVLNNDTSISSFYERFVGNLNSATESLIANNAPVLYNRLNNAWKAYSKSVGKFPSYLQTDDLQLKALLSRQHQLQSILTESAAKNDTIRRAVCEVTIFVMSQLSPPDTTMSIGSPGTVFSPNPRPSPAALFSPNSLSAQRAPFLSPPRTALLKDTSAATALANSLSNLSLHAKEYTPGRSKEMSSGVTSQKQRICDLTHERNPPRPCDSDAAKNNGELSTNASTFIDSASSQLDSNSSKQDLFSYAAQTPRKRNNEVHACPSKKRNLNIYLPARLKHYSSTLAAVSIGTSPHETTAGLGQVQTLPKKQSMFLSTEQLEKAKPSDTAAKRSKERFVMEDEALESLLSVQGMDGPEHDFPDQSSKSGVAVDDEENDENLTSSAEDTELSDAFQNLSLHEEAVVLHSHFGEEDIFGSTDGFFHHTFRPGIEYHANSEQFSFYDVARVIVEGNAINNYWRDQEKNLRYELEGIKTREANRQNTAMVLDTLNDIGSTYEKGVNTWIASFTAQYSKRSATQLFSKAIDVAEVLHKDLVLRRSQTKEQLTSRLYFSISITLFSYVLVMFSLIVMSYSWLLPQCTFVSEEKTTVSRVENQDFPSMSIFDSLSSSIFSRLSSPLAFLDDVYTHFSNAYDNLVVVIGKYYCGAIWMLYITFLGGLCFLLTKAGSIHRILPSALVCLGTLFVIRNDILTFWHMTPWSIMLAQLGAHALIYSWFLWKRASIPALEDIQIERYQYLLQSLPKALRPDHNEDGGNIKSSKTVAIPDPTSPLHLRPYRYFFSFFWPFVASCFGIYLAFFAGQEKLIGNLEYRATLTKSPLCNMVYMVPMCDGLSEATLVQGDTFTAPIFLIFHTLILFVKSFKSLIVPS